MDRRAFSVAIFPRYRGRLLLIWHKRLQTWLPPGGELNDGESPLEAAARELREETGLHGVFPSVSSIAGTPLGFIGYEEHPAGSKGTHMNFVFVADVETDAIEKNNEFDDYKWLTFAEGDEQGVWKLAPPNVAQLALIAYDV